MKSIQRGLCALAAVALLGIGAARSAGAHQPFADVGKQPPITILINSSPWYAGFEKTVELYEKQTGNKVKLDATPYGGMLETNFQTCMRISKQAPTVPSQSAHCQRPCGIPKGRFMGVHRRPCSHFIILTVLRDQQFIYGLLSQNSSSARIQRLADAYP